MSRGVLALLVALLAPVSLPAQATASPTPSPTPAVSPVPTATIQPAEPYTDKEFDPLVLKIRRAEIITVGAFPLAYLLGGLGYDYVYYTTNGFPPANVPWPAGPGTSQWTPATQPEAVQKKNLTLVSLGLFLSLLVAGLDWWLGL